MTLGQKIKKYREESGLTQVELASKANLSQGYLSQLEKGMFVPTALIIIRLAVALSISSDELLGINEASTFFKADTVKTKNEQKGGIL